MAPWNRDPVSGLCPHVGCVQSLSFALIVPIAEEITKTSEINILPFLVDRWSRKIFDLFKKLGRKYEKPTYFT